jgi:hypothetical protein
MFILKYVLLFASLIVRLSVAVICQTVIYIVVNVELIEKLSKLSK